MAKQLIPPIVGLAEAADILGWDKRRVVTYMQRGKFPEPAVRLASGPIWLRKQIEQYVEVCGMKRYTVSAFKMVQTAGGPLLDRTPSKEKEVRTSTEAEKFAQAWTDENQYDAIYIHYTHRDSECYWNPYVGFENSGKNWITHLANESGDKS